MLSQLLFSLLIFKIEETGVIEDFFSLFLILIERNTHIKEKFQSESKEYTPDQLSHGSQNQFTVISFLLFQELDIFNPSVLNISILNQ